jgi:hypothetical protein
MRWWLNTDNKAFSVDNAFVPGGMDFSSLPRDLWMVHWIDGKGEIEYQDPDGVNPNGVPGVNLNGLREKFYDVTPYVPFFQQFLELLPDVTLDQAQRVQVDLIKLLFESKRQLPLSQTVSGTSYWWPADDSSITAMNCAVTPKLIGSLFTLEGTSGGSQTSLVAQLNANYTTWHDQINANYATWKSELDTNFLSYQIQINQNYTTWHDQLNANYNTWYTQIGAVIGTGGSNAGAFNNLVAEINNWIVDPTNNALNQSDAAINYNADQSKGARDAVNTGFNTLSALLQSGPVSGATGNAAVPGLTASLTILPQDWTYTASSYRLTHVDQSFAGGSGISPLSVSPLSIVAVTVSALSISPLSVSAGTIASGGGASIPWLPIGATVAVNLSATDISNIMSGVAARRANLQTIMNTKIKEVMALTTVPAVIAYDVLAGWPTITVPPGYTTDGPIASPAGGVTVTTPPPVSGGIPEAPIDGLMYGRQSAQWHRALAYTNDVLDGGNF